MNNDTIATRLAAIRERLHLSQKDLSVKLGLAVNTWNLWETEKSVPRRSNLSKLKGLGFSPEWVLTGRGAMEMRPGKPEGMPDRLDGDPGFSLIPRINVNASAGYGRIADDVQETGLIAFRTAWLEQIGVNPVMAQALTARGDSMEPTILDGDLLLVDRGATAALREGIYVVTYGESVFVKRVLRKVNGALILRSDNPRYGEQEVSGDDIDLVRIEGQVRWFGRTI